MKMIEATEEDFPAIRIIARETWYDTYSDILTGEQSEYMLEWMYSDSSLKDQIENKQHRYLLLEDDGRYIAYLSYELNYDEQAKTKIHKLYILPAYHRKGLGKLFVNKVTELASQNFDTALLLNMNKSNKAIAFYENMGFRIVNEECNDIGNGFVMDDYVFEKNLV